ncbi:MAG: T9SS type A sorting domain-containing protein [candidate division WOR-3 bacterium]|nr:T9SS type A sorting domain-containing protein [candidate division WOR-3 bacterium]
MNLLFVLMPLLLQSGIIKESFRIAEAEPRHHQVHLRAAMASDGRFAVAWVDSLQLPDHFELDIFIRFFDREGNPLNDAYKITKLMDTTTWIYHPCLEMDSLGNAALIWADNRAWSGEDTGYIRFQSFGPDGSPLIPAQTLYDIGLGPYSRIGLSLANNGEFAVAVGMRFPERGYCIGVQRFDLDGVPIPPPFPAHDSLPDSLPGHFTYPQVSLNDAGDIVVTWLHFIDTPHMFPCFQVFDAQDESILPWEPLGHRLDDGGEECGACRPEPHWLDNDRFVVFYSDYCAPRPTVFIPVLGRVFSNRGLTRHPIRTVMWGDSTGVVSNYRGSFRTAVLPNDSFAYTHTRSYYDYPDTSNPWKPRTWEHGAGFLGEVINNEPTRRTNLFEYTPAWGADTVNSNFGNWTHVQPSAVACCDDRIVWVYSRLNTDTIFEAFAIITDWDMGVGVVESPIQTESPIRLSASLNRLSYDVPDEASLTLYSSDGRRVLTETIKGEGIWQAPKLPSGVYFARVKDNSASARAKLVILH